MQRISVDISGAGDHEIVSSSSGQIIQVHKMLLTFSHASDAALAVEFLSGARVVAGPFYVMNGGEISYLEIAGQTMDIREGESFYIRLPANLACGGIFDYDIAVVA